MLSELMELTSDQKKDRERLERYIAREGLSSVMNQTRWREAIQVLLQTQGYGLRFLVKCLREPEASAIQWESSFPYHVPQPFTVIEWLEVDPVVRKRQGQVVAEEVQDHTEAVLTALRSRNVPCFQVHGLIRIPGYLRVPQPPA